VFFILRGTVTKENERTRKVTRLTTANTFGSEAILDPKFKVRAESAFVEESTARVLELRKGQLLKLRQVLYQMGLKTDYL